MYLRSGLDAAVAVTNEECRQAMRDLHAAGVGAGPCGAASPAGYRRAPVEGVVVLLSTESEQHL
jgi:diaminopropionate ammonia-lyase